METRWRVLYREVIGDNPPGPWFVLSTNRHGPANPWPTKTGAKIAARSLDQYVYGRGTDGRWQRVGHKEVKIQSQVVVSEWTDWTDEPSP